MRLSQVDRSTGWLGIVMGAVLLAWSLPPVWSFVSEGSAQFVIRHVRLTDNGAVIAAGILAICGIVLIGIGLAVLVKNRA